MRVAILTTHLPPVMGGIEVHCANLAEALSGAGHDVVLYGSLEAHQSPEMTHEVLGDRLRVTRIPARHDSPLKRPSRLYHLARALAGDHRVRPYDVLHAHQLYPVGLAGMLFSRAFGVPLVVTEHGDVLDHHQVMWKRPLLRLVAHRANRVVTASRELSEVIGSVGVPSGKLLPIPNAIWPDAYSRNVGGIEIRQKFGIADESFVAMTLRRLVPKTGVRYAIEAIARCGEEIKDCHLVVVGDGPQRAELEELARSQQVADRVHFAGSVPNERVPSYIDAADVGFFPSLAEATSIAALEFMAAGKPVIASAVGGLPEIIQDGKIGYLVDFGFTRSRYTDPGLSGEVVDRLARALVVASKSDLDSLGRNARRAVEAKYSWPAYVERLENEAYPAVNP